MKKILLTLLVSALMFSAASCGGGNAPIVDKDETLDVELEQNIGGTFLIKTESTRSLSLAPEASDDIRQDIINYRYKEVSAKYNCAVSAVIVPEGELLKNLAASASVTDTYADVFQLPAGDIYNLYKGGYLTSLQDVKGIDPADEKWGFENQKAMMTFGDGKTYGFRNTYWSAPLQDLSGVLFYNEALITKNMQANPYELYESRTWNWSAFETICKGVTQTVGDLQSTYGFMVPTASYPDFIHAAIYSNGGQRLKTTDTGAYTCGYNDSKTIEALEWVRDLVNVEKVCYVPGALDLVQNVDVMSFTDGYTAFLVSGSYTGFYNGNGYPISVLGEGFRWIEFPRGESFKGNSSAYYTKDDMFIALSSSFDTENKGVILNAIFEPLGDETTESWKDYLSTNYFFYEEDSQLFFDMLMNSVSDYSILTRNSNESIDDVFEAVINGKKTPKEAVEMLSPVVSGLLE